jgi:hypothetical protein
VHPNPLNKVVAKRNKNVKPLISSSYFNYRKKNQFLCVLLPCCDYFSYVPLDWGILKIKVNLEVI